jgi:hypothetical protein
MSGSRVEVTSVEDRVALKVKVLQPYRVNELVLPVKHLP